MPEIKTATEISNQLGHFNSRGFTKKTDQAVFTQDSYGDDNNSIVRKPLATRRSQGKI